MGLFSKETTCEKCGSAIPKKQLCLYDSTHQGRNRSGFSTKVCSHCLMELFYESLRSFHDSAVVVSPIQGHNAYVAYHFGMLKSVKQNSRAMEEKNNSLIDNLSELLPKSGTICNCCGNQATYVWCSPDLLKNDPFLWEVNTNTNYEPMYLCGECLIRKFQKKLEDDGIRFACIYPPLQGAGFLCSWEV